MKIAIAKEHREFYKKNGWIEFENILTNDQLVLFNRSIDQVLSEKLKVPEDKVVAVSSESAFQHGRDLWRSNEALRKLIFMPRIGEIVSELIELKPLRIGYDQYLPPIAASSISKSPLYHKFLGDEQNLENMSSIKGVVAGLIICLTSTKEEVEENKEVEVNKQVEVNNQIDIFPNLPGHVIVINPTVSFNFSNLPTHPNQRYYLIVYVQNSSYYYLQPNDPHTHHLKKYGYVFNDKLSDKLNPVVYR